MPDKLEIPEAAVEALVADLIQECERAIKQREEALLDPTKRSEDGRTHDTVFGFIIRKHLAMLPHMPDHGYAEGIEAAAQVARDNTPDKHNGTLAAHVTGATIEAAIRALAPPAPADNGWDERIENAKLSMSETSVSWESRCHAIMAALGINYGRMDEFLPDEDPTPDKPEIPDAAVEAAMEKLRWQLPADDGTGEIWRIMRSALAAAIPHMPGRGYAEVDWRCAKCDCHSFARIDRLSDGGKRAFEPGDYVRCVNCKDESYFPLSPASGE